ncbi:TRAP transporter small permease subunit [Pasteurella skyensis]|uniref:TRAP transporter small permease protein n=1 Tax=Phocoenobacter skyensis TaxID=97481 RepID=A0AAJ6P0D5_9PAST|nr:TRAP transporter small permease subunit [Pasteurella skyensis]MDP8162505.1 TRAP transporter small permease subunit [Pasteurella skyensis]MDP8172470.1 TRAP transporter small permease subunit [Pasteurella skyensis]MDP8177495.1 TRAP transporter small permease subunit [Pasteurella skyensis]MDP8178725.1 TRAP transporter small permease subunit [Pasteurella skyensis]MDP8182985.1 TRAP transporter small permease subunit [Pasteurella skyensis]
MNTHSRLDNLLTLTCSALATVGLLALIIVSALTVVDAILRQFFATHIDGLSDWLRFCVILAVSCCFPATIWDKHSITVRILGKIVHWRLRELFESIGQTILFLCLVIIGWQLYTYTYELWDYGDVSDLLLLPKWPVWTVATGIWWLTALIQGYLTIRQWSFVFAETEIFHEEIDKEAW